MYLGSGWIRMGGKLIPGINDLQTRFPELAQEWDFERNSTTPSEIMPHSDKKVWWICAKGHTYEAMVKNRSRGSGCPYCAGKLAIPGETDLLTRNPQLANEWNYEKNGDMLPSNVTVFSGKKVWWRCSKCKYEWLATVKNRANGANCPACQDYTTIVIKGKNDLTSTNPELIQEWDFEKNDISPYEVSRGSHKKVWWKVVHCNPITRQRAVLSWPAVIKDRVNGEGCPYLTNGKLLKGFNDLATMRPDIVREWNFERNCGLSPDEYTIGSHEKVWWKCEVCDTEWKTTIKDRVRGTGCPFCTKYTRTSFPEQAVFYYVKKYYPDAINTYKEIFDNRMELDIYIPSLNIGVEYDGIYWHQIAGAAARASLKYTICKENGIAIIRITEDINKTEKAYCDELIFCDFSHKEYHKIDTTVIELLNKLGYLEKTDIDTERDEIRIRELYTISIESLSLKKNYPEIAKQWHPTKNGKLKPEMFSVSSSYRAWWYCPVCGGEWKVSIDNRTASYKKGQGKCPICSNHRLRKGFNDLESWCKKNNSNLLQLWDYEKNINKPDDYMPKSSKSVFWKCRTCGESWNARISVATTWRSCPQCLKKKRIKMVQQFDKTGKLIGEFKTAEDAASVLNIDMTAIRRVCRGERTEFKGFVWKYKE